MKTDAVRVALVGIPNSGKSVLYNELTGGHQRVANFAGVTLEKAEGLLRNGYKKLFRETITREMSVWDLPGAYSLKPYSEDEHALVRAITEVPFQATVFVLDATQLNRSLRLLLDFSSKTKSPVVVAVNLMDVLEHRGIQIDLEKLSLETGLPVVGISAKHRQGISELLGLLEKALLGPVPSTTARRFSTDNSASMISLFKEADRIEKQVLIPSDRSSKAAVFEGKGFDRWVLHPILGPILFSLTMVGIFQLMFNFAETPMAWIEAGFQYLADGVNAQTGIPEMLRGLIVDGVIAGISGTLVFLPQIIILFAAILFLEDLGFMARGVFLLDRLMGRVGLSGRAFLPLLSSFACAVPGVIAARSLEKKQERWMTIAMSTIFTCSARIPVYTVLIAAFIPNLAVGLGIKLQGLVMFSLYVLGAGVAFLGAGLFRKFVRQDQKTPLFLELPDYRLPSVRFMLRELAYRVRLFIARVGTVITVVSIGIWALVSFPTASVQDNYAARIGRAIEPLTAPIGFDWRINMALIPGLAAREVIVGALSTVYAVESQDEEAGQVLLASRISSEWSMATGLSLLVWYVFAPQCLSTFATIRRETGSWKFTLLLFAALMVLAYLASFLVFRLASMMTLVTQG